MTDKCDRYESLFVFGTEQELENHIAICPDCREQHEMLNKTAFVAREVAPHYANYGKTKPLQLAIKAAAGFIVITLAYFIINHGAMQGDIDGYNLSYTQNESVISEMGLPTDEYGLLMVY